MVTSTSQDLVSFFSLMFFVFLLSGFMIGYKSGLIMQLLTVISFRLYNILDFNFKEPTRDFLTMIGFEDSSKLVGIVATIFIFFILFIIMSIINRAASFIFRLMLLGQLNSILGGAVGLITSCVVLGCLFEFMQGANMDIPEKLVFNPNEMIYLAKHVLGTDTIEKAREWGEALFNGLKKNILK